MEAVAKALSAGNFVIISRYLLNRQGSFVIGSAITVACNGLSILLSGITSILIARAIGPEQLGYLVWFSSGTGTVALFADFLGIYYANAYLLASAHQTVDVQRIRGTIVGYGLVIGFLAGLLFVLVKPLRLVTFQGFVEPAWGILIGLNVFGFVLLNQIRSLLLGSRNFLTLGVSNLFQAGLYFVFALILAYGLGFRSSIKVTLAQVASTWICVITLLIPLLWQGIKFPSFEYLKACFRIGRRAAIINWLSFLHMRVDQYLVNTFLGPSALGLYGVAVSLGELLTRIPSMLGMVLFSTVASSQDPREATQKTIRRTWMVIITTGIASFILAIFAPVVVKVLYGEGFSRSVEPLRLLLPAMIFLSGLLMINNHFAGSGYPSLLIISMVIGLIANILLNLSLLPSVGVSGASIASTVTYGLQFLFVLGCLVMALKGKAWS